MRHANTPSGPGKSTSARRDAATQAEELAELTAPPPNGDASSSQADSSRDARHAERGAHVGGQNRRTMNGPGLSHARR
jgi:hypothetical protein